MVHCWWQAWQCTPWMVHVHAEVDLITPTFSFPTHSCSNHILEI